MIPWQIYCDYLEDRGIDTRLFRTLEPSEQVDCIEDEYEAFLNHAYVTGDKVMANMEIYCWQDNGDGWGVGSYGDDYGNGHSSVVWF